MSKRYFRSTFAALITSTALIAFPALAQDAPADEEAAINPDIVVTAQKRSESLQNVPISITALGTKKLDELGVSNFSTYSQQLPSVSAQSGGTPGTNVIYMRGVASGGDGNHSGSLPSVGVYLDEQPVTTIGGNLDVHVYDIARIESLSGPQGTLYGASSEAGTIRIITNKPNPGGIDWRFDAEANSVEHGGQGGKLEGMFNLPLGNRAALRVIGFYQRDAGYIDNVPGTRTFCGTTIFDTDPMSPDFGDAIGCIRDGISVNNAAFVKNDTNYTDTYGGRAALLVELDDNWTVTPAIMYQQTKSHGSYAYDPSVGDLQYQHFFEESRDDKFVQAALTIEGKIGSWDVTYAAAYLDRKTASTNDYTDYSEAYDSYYESVGGLAYYFAYVDSGGNTIDPRQKVLGTDHFKKFSQELRFASPSDNPVRFVGGAFYQYQSNDIHQDYQIANLGPNVSVNGFPGTLWLTEQHRIDRDYAMFGEVSFDLAPTVTATVGGRAFYYNNDLIGFFGFGRNPGGNYTASPPNAAYSSRTGVIQCFTSTGARLTDVVGTPGITFASGGVAGTPCTNLGVWEAGSLRPVVAKDHGFTYRANLTWKPNRDVLIYGTASRGFRPGGINRRGDFGAYQPDYLQNYELGFKTTWADGRVRLNGAVYQQEWKDFQFSYLGPNSFTVIVNGPDARIKGFDLDLAGNFGPLAINLAGAYTDAKIVQNLCSGIDPTFACTTPGNSIDAPAGTRLPITPKWKMSGTIRYTVPVGSAKGFVQLNGMYKSSAPSDLRLANNALQGDLKGFGALNFALGADWDKFNFEFFVNNLTDERGDLSRFVQCGQCTRVYIVPTQPRTFGVRIGAKY